MEQATVEDGLWPSFKARFFLHDEGDIMPSDTMSENRRRQKCPHVAPPICGTNTHPAETIGFGRAIRGARQGLCAIYTQNRKKLCFDAGV